MKLFKCYHVDSNSPDTVYAIWGSSKDSVFDKVAQLESQKECYQDYIFIDTCLDELLTDLNGNNSLFAYLVNGQQDKFAKEYVKTVEKDCWKIEEVLVPKESHIFLVCNKDVIEVDEDIFICSVPYTVQDIEGYILDYVSEMDSKASHFREFVNDKAINMSFAERFFYDDEGYYFKPTLPVEVRDDIGADIDTLFANNVNTFFGEHVGYRDEYFDYLYSSSEPTFDDDFYKFICKRLMQLDEWGSYDIVKVDIVAE